MLALPAAPSEEAVPRAEQRPRTTARGVASEREGQRTLPGISPPAHSSAGTRAPQAGPRSLQVRLGPLWASRPPRAPGKAWPWLSQRRALLAPRACQAAAPPAPGTADAAPRLSRPRGTRGAAERHHGDARLFHPLPESSELQTQPRSPGVCSATFSACSKAQRRSSAAPASPPAGAARPPAQPPLLACQQGPWQPANPTTPERIPASRAQQHKIPGRETVPRLHFPLFRVAPGPQPRLSAAAVPGGLRTPRSLQQNAESSPAPEPARASPRPGSSSSLQTQLLGPPQRAAGSSPCAAAWLLPRPARRHLPPASLHLPLQRTPLPACSVGTKALRLSCRLPGATSSLSQVRWGPSAPGVSQQSRVKGSARPRALPANRRSSDAAPRPSEPLAPPRTGIPPRGQQRPAAALRGARTPRPLTPAAGTARGARSPLPSTHLFRRQRLVQHLNIWMLGEVVEFAQVRDYSLQVLQKLPRDQAVSEKQRPAARPRLSSAPSLAEERWTRGGAAPSIHSRGARAAQPDLPAAGGAQQGLTPPGAASPLLAAPPQAAPAHQRVSLPDFHQPLQDSCQVRVVRLHGPDGGNGWVRLLERRGEGGFQLLPPPPSH